MIHHSVYTVNGRPPPTFGVGLDLGGDVGDFAEEAELALVEGLGGAGERGDDGALDVLQRFVQVRCAHHRRQSALPLACTVVRYEKCRAKEKRVAPEQCQSAIRGAI